MDLYTQKSSPLANSADMDDEMDEDKDDKEEDIMDEKEEDDVEEE